jgi:hypothetical protein
MAERIDLPENEEENVQPEAPAQAQAPPPRAPRARRQAIVQQPDGVQASKVKKLFDAQPDTMLGWLYGHQEDPDQFTYTSEGDLQVPALFTGDVIRVIPVPKVQPATVDYTADFFKTKATAIQEQEAIYVQKKRELKRIVLLHKNGGATIDDVLNANSKVAVEEYKLNGLIKLPRKIGIAEGVESGLTMNLYDKKTLYDPIHFTTYTAFPTKSMWMPAPEPEVAARQPLPLRQSEDSSSDSNSNNTPPPASRKPLTAQQIAIIRSRMARK